MHPPWERYATSCEPRGDVNEPSESSVAAPLYDRILTSLQSHLGLWNELSQADPVHFASIMAVASQFL
jgi:hypothetical protein